MFRNNEFRYFCNSGHLCSRRAYRNAPDFGFVRISFKMWNIRSCVLYGTFVARDQTSSDEKITFANLKGEARLYLQELSQTATGTSSKCFVMPLKKNYLSLEKPKKFHVMIYR